MMRALLRSVIRNATVTHADSASLRIDPLLLRAAEILPLERVDLVNVATGAHFTTFAEPGEEGSGEVRVHGPARAGDVVSILCWGFLHDGQTLGHRAKVVTVDGKNRV
ncbi:MAG TPA: aspartate 1-decarboxylase, partial [Thermoanaerobaculia bacterium]|nr:aspartate 1-decarboxylase [Thermoanaerobaculia bacterium]